MSNKSRNVLWMVAGMYLAYTGFTLMNNVLGEHPDKMVLFMVIAVVFMGAGVFLVVYAIRNLYKNINSADTVEVDEEEAAEGAQEAKEALEKLEAAEADLPEESLEADSKEE